MICKRGLFISTCLILDYEPKKIGKTLLVIEEFFLYKLNELEQFSRLACSNFESTNLQ